MVTWEVGVEGPPCELGMSMTYCVYRLVTFGFPPVVLVPGIRGKACLLPRSSDAWF